MQATVASFDPVTRCGAAFLDDGTRIEFPAEAFDASGLRLLRLGQRVRLTGTPERITAVSLITMPPSGAA